MSYTATAPIRLGDDGVLVIRPLYSSMRRGIPESGMTFSARFPARTALERETAGSPPPARRLLVRR